MFNPDYKSPSSVQMNIGVQRELKRGVVLSVDYIRNVETHYLLGVDENHAGDIAYFNKAGALDAIAATNTKFGRAPTPGAGVDCAISGVNQGGVGATISDYSSVGLEQRVCQLEHEVSSANNDRGDYGPGVRAAQPRHLV